MSLVEQVYQQAIDAMAPADKLARAETLLAWTRNSIARRLRAEWGAEVSDARIRWETALRMYESEPAIARLIREQIARVPT